jgi:outer membrane protein assembly factor BamB
MKLPHEGGHYTGSLASNSAVTDGEHVFAFFGSHGLYCLDMDGEVKWEKHFGEMQTKHGHGESASPVLYGDALFVNWDQDGPCFLEAIDKRTGNRLWRVERNEETSWSSPIIAENDGQPMLIVAGTNRVRAYDPATGRVIWECGGLSSNIADRVVWTRSRGTPYVPSPLLYGDTIYFLSHYQGVLSRVEGLTGADKPGAFRLGSMGNIYASPVAGGGRIYVTDLEGKTIVVSHDDRPQALAVNLLDDEFAASAAIVGRELFLRGKTHLYCIAEDEGP